MSRQNVDESFGIKRLAGGASALRKVWASIGDAFDPPIWERYQDYDAFVEKVAAHATTLVASSATGACGAISFYANDTQTHRAFVTEVLVAPAYQGRGVGTRLLRACEDYATRVGMTSMGLEVAQDNVRALSLYSKLGYSVEAKRASTYVMRKALG